MTAAAVAPPVPPAAVERLEAFCDAGSLTVLRSAVGDDVVAGLGRVAGRPVVCFAQDGCLAGERDADTVVRALALAGRARAPVIGFLAGSGARRRGRLDALAGQARVLRAQVALSGRVPQVAVVRGAAAADRCGLADFVVMGGGARRLASGPAAIHAATDPDAVARELLGLLRAPVAPAQDPPAAVPEDLGGAYDVRTVVRALADGGRLLEWAPRWAPNVVCGLVRLGGQAAGTVASQPAHRAGVLCAEAADKAARFVDRCDAFGLPLVVLVDSPGVHGYGGALAGLARAFARASVPRVTVVLRRALGDALVVMNSRDLGADLVFAWPGAALGAVDVPAAAAAAGGHVDAVIAPNATRARLVEALSSLAGRATCAERPATRAEPARRAARTIGRCETGTAAAV